MEQRAQILMAFSLLVYHEGSSMFSLYAMVFCNTRTMVSCVHRCHKQHLVTRAELSGSKLTPSLVLHNMIFLHDSS